MAKDSTETFVSQELQNRLEDAESDDVEGRIMSERRRDAVGTPLLATILQDSTELSVREETHDNIENTDQAGDEIDSESESGGGGSPLLAAVFVLPAKLAVGVLSLLAGFGAARRAGASTKGTAISGIISMVVLQALVILAKGGAMRRLREEERRAISADKHSVGWVDAIQAVAHIVRRFSEGLSLPAGLKYVFLDKRLVRLYHSEVSARLKRAARRGPRSPQNTLVEGRYYSEYAMAAYGYLLLKALGMLDPSYDYRLYGMRTVDVVKYRLRLNDDAILVARLDGEVIGVPRHFVAVDDDMHTIVVTIRGTNSVQDVITDLLCGDVPFASGFAHKGMKDAASALFTAVLPTLRSALKTRPAYSLVVCGHSLGAGVALLLTKILLDAGFAGVKCFAIAPCPVFGPRSKIDEEWSDAVECFVHAEDLVSQLCLSSARRLALEIERVDALPLSHEQRQELRCETDRLAGIIDGQSRRAARTDPRERREEHLYIPSKRGVHWLLPEDDSDDASRERGRWFWRRREARNAQDEFTEFPWGNWDIPKANQPKMRSVSSHFPNSYASAFASLPIPPPAELPAPPRPGSQITGQYFGELGQL